MSSTPEQVYQTHLLQTGKVLDFAQMTPTSLQDNMHYII